MILFCVRWAGGAFLPPKELSYNALKRLTLCHSSFLAVYLLEAV